MEPHHEYLCQHLVQLKYYSECITLNIAENSSTHTHVSQFSTGLGNTRLEQGWAFIQVKVKPKLGMGSQVCNLQVNIVVIVRELVWLL